MALTKLTNSITCPIFRSYLYIQILVTRLVSNLRGLALNKRKGGINFERRNNGIFSMSQASGKEKSESPTGIELETFRTPVGPSN